MLNLANIDPPEGASRPAAWFSPKRTGHSSSHRKRIIANRSIYPGEANHSPGFSNAWFRKLLEFTLSLRPDLSLFNSKLSDWSSRVTDLGRYLSREVVSWARMELPPVATAVFRWRVVGLRSAARGKPKSELNLAGSAWKVPAPAETKAPYFRRARGTRKFGSNPSCRTSRVCVPACTSPRRTHTGRNSSQRAPEPT
jgi:hypothetical protein